MIEIYKDIQTNAREKPSYKITGELRDLKFAYRVRLGLKDTDSNKKQADIQMKITNKSKKIKSNQFWRLFLLLQPKIQLRNEQAQSDL